MAWMRLLIDRLRRHLLPSVALSLVATVACALDPQRPIAEFVHDNWSVDSGLPQSTIASDIVQTADGYLWLGTHEGLARFNGHEFRVYDSDSAPELASNGIMDLAAARNGDLLIGLRDGGLARLHEGVIHAIPTPDVQAGVLAIAEDADGTLWLGTRGGGLMRLPPGGAASVIGAAEGMPDGVVAALLRSPEGFLWVGTRRGLLRLIWQDGGARLTPEPDMPLVSVSDLVLDRAGRLWVATLDAGLLLRENGVWRSYGTSEGLASSTAARVREDLSGALWIGTVAGLQRLVDGHFDAPLGADEGLTSDVVRSIQVDVEGSIWVGTDSGLDRFRDGLIYAIRPGRGPGEGAIRSVAVDRAGNLWIGTTNGLFRHRDGVSRRYDRGDGLSSESVLAVREDAHGVLWAATQDGGVHTLIGDTFVDISTELEAAAGMPRGIQRVLLKVRGGVLLGSQFGVLFVGDDGRREFYGKVQGLLREQVLSLFEDAAGRIWVGSRFGVMRMRRAPPGSPSSFVIDTLPEAFAFPAPVLGMAGLDANRVLLATGRGLMLADDEHVRALGNLQRTLFNVVDDGVDQWWMCSNTGLYRIDRSAMQALVDAAPAGPRLSPFALLDRGDGMPTSQCNGGSEPSSAQLPDGRLAFATARGVAVVDGSRRLANNPRPPPVHFETAEIDFQPVALPDAGQQLILAPGQRRLDLSFVGLSLVDPVAVRYRYQLEGEDSDWIDAGDRRTAVLANLAPGSYRFRVTASNNSGVWNTEGATLDLLVRPSWTQTWWFRSLLVAMVLLVALLAVRLRLRALARHAQELAVLVRQKTADLATERDRLVQAGDEKGRLLNQLAEQSAQFEQLSRLDGLTQLANRREFDRALDAAATAGRPLCLALGDVDHFKEINDHYSHVVGDEVLRTLASIVRAHCAPGQLPVRFGGEELALIIPESSLADACSQAELIRQAIERHPWDSLRAGLKVTISFGVADSREVQGVAGLLTLADLRLYQSKAAGRNQVSP